MCGGEWFQNNRNQQGIVRGELKNMRGTLPFWWKQSCCQLCPWWAIWVLPINLNTNFVQEPEEQLSLFSYLLHHDIIMISVQMSDFLLCGATNCSATTRLSVWELVGVASVRKEQGWKTECPGCRYKIAGLCPLEKNEGAHSRNTNMPPLLLHICEGISFQKI